MPVRGNTAGLGALTLHSSLGQHLDAEIEVITDNATELESIKATMAPADIFHQMGIAPVSVIQHIRFDIDKESATNSSGGAILKLSSTQPVREPFLDLVVELSWNGGTYLREYTFLLDPVITQSSHSLDNGNDATLVDSESLISSEDIALSVLVPSTDSVTVVPEHIIVVQRGDNLLDIARSIPATNLSAEQVAVAIYENNPHAFFGSVHKLKRGAELFVPDLNSVAVVTTSDARQALGSKISRRSIARAAPDKSATNLLPEAQVAQSEQLVSTAAQPAEQASKQAVAEVSGHINATQRDESDTSVKALQVVIMELRTAMVGLGDELDVKTSQLDDIGKRVDQLQKRQAISSTSAKAGALVVPVPAIKQISKDQDSPSKPASAALQEKPLAAKTDSQIGLNSTAVDDSDAIVESPKSTLLDKKPRELMTVDSADSIASNEDQAALVNASADTVDNRASEKTGMFSWFFDSDKNRLVGNSIRNVGLALLFPLIGYALFRRYFVNDDRLVDLEATPAAANSKGIHLDVPRSPPGEVSDVVNPLSAIEYFREQLTGEQSREQGLKDALTERPEQQHTRLELLRVYHERGSAEMFATTARDMYAMTNGKNPEWYEVIEMGLALDPNMSFYDETGEHGFVLKDEFNVGGGGITSVPGGKSINSTPAAKQKQGNLVSAEKDRAQVRLDEMVSKPELDSDTEVDIDLDLVPEEDTRPYLDEAALDKVEWNNTHEDGLTNDELNSLKPVASPSQLDSTFDLKPGSYLDLGESDDQLTHQAIDADNEPNKIEPQSVSDSTADSDSVSYFKPELSWKDCEVRLDLAVVYIDMGNADGAHGLLSEVLAHGDSAQKKVAQGMMSKLK